MKADKQAKKYKKKNQKNKQPEIPQANKHFLTLPSVKENTNKSFPDLLTFLWVNISVHYLPTGDPWFPPLIN